MWLTRARRPRRNRSAAAPSAAARAAPWRRGDVRRSRRGGGPGRREAATRTCRHARQYSFHTAGKESVGGLRQLTPYNVPRLSPRGRESYGLRHLRIECRRVGHRAGQRRSHRRRLGAGLPGRSRRVVHPWHAVGALPRRDPQGRRHRRAGARRRAGRDAGRRPDQAQRAAGHRPPASLRHRPRRRAAPALRPARRPGARAADDDGRDGALPGRRPARLAAARRVLGGELRRRLRRHLAERQPALLLQHLRQPLHRRRLPRPPEGLNPPLGTISPPDRSGSWLSTGREPGPRTIRSPDHSGPPATSVRVTGDRRVTCQRIVTSRIRAARASPSSSSAYVPNARTTGRVAVTPHRRPVIHSAPSASAVSARPPTRVTSGDTELFSVECTLATFATARPVAMTATAVHHVAAPPLADRDARHAKKPLPTNSAVVKSRGTPPTATM